jgi:hypothetical protein
MYKAFQTFALTAALACCLAIPAGAEGAAAISDLVEQAADYTGETVTVEGEAIGEALERGEYTWVNLSDGTNAIGIWLKASDAEAITYYGDYKHTGDTVRVTGVFSRDCTEHGGDVDLHAASLKIVRQGDIVREEVPREKIAVAAGLFCAALLVARICLVRKS